jgi:hypothetical protein
MTSTAEKIQSFINDQINQTKNSIVIRENQNVYYVNNFKIKFLNDNWAVVNNKKQQIGQFKNKRLAILFAALQIKKKYTLRDFVDKIDFQLFCLKQDKIHFEKRLQDTKRIQICEDRLGRIEYELEMFFNQIDELEKSVGLR